MENLRGEQVIRLSEAVPDLYKLPPEQAQKHRVYDGDYEPWASPSPVSKLLTRME